MCRVSRCPHCLVFLLGGLWENLIFVGAKFIGLTNFPRGPTGLPLAIYLFFDNYCGVRGIFLPMCFSPAILSLIAIKGEAPAAVLSLQPSVWGVTPRAEDCLEGWLMAHCRDLDDGIPKHLPLLLRAMQRRRY
jgi:hypothetical protein